MNKTAESIINNSTIEEQIEFCLEMLTELNEDREKIKNLKKRVHRLSSLFFRHAYGREFLEDLVYEKLYPEEN